MAEGGRARKSKSVNAEVVSARECMSQPLSTSIRRVNFNNIDLRGQSKFAWNTHSTPNQSSNICENLQIFSFDRGFGVLGFWGFGVLGTAGLA